jgi:acyl-CoA thioesterase YciA
MIEPPNVPALRRVTNPGDANHQGTIFGGFILGAIDEAAYVEARKHGVHRWVTVSIDRVEFKSPVHVGDVVSLYTKPVNFGRSSITVEVRVVAERWVGGASAEVTTAVVKMVAIDRHGQSIDYRSPATVVEKA